MDKYYHKLLDNNIKVTQARLVEDPDFYKNLSLGQQPKVLWIGCADSRLAANEITGTRQGEIFVHRNIANMVVHSDMNMLSVLDYAVNVLKVEHVIVCGHYGCGGIEAAMSNKQYGLIDNWLRHLKDVYRLYQQELDAIEDEPKRLRRFVEVNVFEQVFDLCKTSIIQNAWQHRQAPHVHGWVYDISTGLIKDLDVTVRIDEDLTKIFHFQNLLISKEGKLS
ncbi:MAG: carbonic anhydrase [Saprospiraceae bacterium]|nr:carbonic anhydrase [Saprospiraceae bacterium]MCF8249449.1 carbonic anhydrase [Saprospiraceae bacterium]MCF8279103.1 carbonic anhydrase [Bacteroidales bacterium]MCF8311578.1 carbonic anhydrase [Saprospiraceae bacterium]MCF8440068.1 carbonic anhydrase [Saprospiraceae bacterium]